MLRRGKAGFKQDLFDKRWAIDWSDEVGIYLKNHKLGDQWKPIIALHHWLLYDSVYLGRIFAVQSIVTDPC